VESTGSGSVELDPGSAPFSLKVMHGMWSLQTCVHAAVWPWKSPSYRDVTILWVVYRAICLSGFHLSGDITSVLAVCAVYGAGTGVG
jgi:hypothetical protein